MPDIICIRGSSKGREEVSISNTMYTLDRSFECLNVLSGQITSCIGWMCKCIQTMPYNHDSVAMTAQVPLSYYTYTRVFELFRSVREDMVLHLPYGARR